MRGALYRLAVFALLGACSSEENLVPLDWSLNRMIHQARYDAFDPAEGFPDGRVLQPPPVGTVPREDRIGPQEFVLGLDAQGEFVAEVPVPVDLAFLEMGRNRYDRVCGVCHGNAGYGESEVADKMPFVRPPSLHREDIRAFAPGRLFQVITFGYGLMPPYSYQLTIEERWAIVAYVEALQFSRNAQLSALPQELQRRFSSEVP